MPFTASIITRDFTTVYDNALLLGGASYLRTLTYGGAWSRIRIGALIGLNANATFQDGMLLLGLCSGKDAPASAYNTRSAYGYSFCGSPVVGATRTWTYTANSGYPYMAPTTGVVYRRTTPVGWQVSAAGGAFWAPSAYTGTQKRRFPIYFDITRNLGGGGIVRAIAYGINNATTAQIDFRPDHFQDGLDQLGTPTIYNTTLSAGTALATVDITDMFGPMDTFELFWSSTAYPLEVYAVGAVIINPAFNSETSLPYTVSDAGGIDYVEQYTPDMEIYTFGDYGTGFVTGGTVFGASFGTTVIGVLGTSGGVPTENFQQYTVGVVTSGVTINAGTGWSSYGSIY